MNYPRYGELAKERDDLLDILKALLSKTRMILVRERRGWWRCPYCLATHSDLTTLENGYGHEPNCPYARARQALRRE